MKEWKLLGKKCRDIVSGFEGICTGVIEYLYGCEMYKIQGKITEGGKKEDPHFFFEKQLEIIGDGIPAEIPGYEEPRFFGKEC